MALSKVFDRFSLHSPIPVMMRGILEYGLSREHIDELFRENAENQYEDELLFSTAVNALSLAVCGVRKSVNAAYKASRDEFTVSVESLYNKLKGTEIQVSRALVRTTAERLGPVIRAMKATLPPIFPGYRLRIIDGNHLSGTEHRLKETRTLNSCPLPGHALVVLEPELMLATDVFPCEDAYTQERQLLDDVLETVEKGDVWMADRNFCTTTYVFGIAKRGAHFVIREHGSNLCGRTLLGKRRKVGRSETGMVYEQKMRVVNRNDNDREMVLRRITIVLDEPTRDGDRELHILTNLPKRQGAIHIAEAYRKRWTIETAFQELGQALESEIKTLCYPKAALLCLCVGLYSYNMLSVVKAALRAVYPDEATVDNLSGYYLAEEISAVYGGMLVAIVPQQWTKHFGSPTVRQMAKLLKDLAANVDVTRFRKNQRGPKKPPPKRRGGLREKHVSTARILEERKTRAKAA